MGRGVDWLSHRAVDVEVSDHDQAGRPGYEKGVAVVGSSNLTLSGITHNTELNVVVQGNSNHDELVRWFDELWDESDDFDAALMHEMQQSWAMAMVPNFAKSLVDFKGFSTINAKAETLLSKPLWRVPFHRRRCLIPADGFYEWKRLDEKTKQPYAFAMSNGEPFAFGGVWDAWKDPATEDWLQSFSIITTDPNELTATVHDRMPVILKPSDYDRRLDRVDTERPPADLLKPYDAAEMESHPVHPRIGNLRNDEPGLCTTWKCPPNSV
jgi:putative SOS response-associated peptidase YedK